MLEHVPGRPRAALLLVAAAGALILSACVAYDTPYNEDKVTVCHKGKKTLVIPQSAVSAHVGHGDTMGPCE